MIDAINAQFLKHDLTPLEKIRWGNDARIFDPTYYTQDKRNRVKPFLTGWQDYLDNPKAVANDITTPQLKMNWPNLGRAIASVMGNLTLDDRRTVYAILVHQYLQSPRTQHWTDADRAMALKLFPIAVTATFDSLRVRTADDADSAMAGNGSSFVPQNGDGRTVVQRQIYERRGQQAFRDALRSRYGNRCLVTGCELLDVLEAAHIKPYRGEADNHVENGLLLRADIHTLFDLNLLGIEPEQLIIQLHPSLTNDSYYGSFSGVRLGCTAASRPSIDALKFRYNEFTNHAS